MSGTVYDKIIDGIRYTPAHQTMVNIKDDQGRIVASVQVNGTYGASAHYSTDDWPDSFEIESRHTHWEPVNYHQPLIPAFISKDRAATSDRIAEIIREHWTCHCGEWAENLEEQFAHVAQQIAAQLEIEDNHAEPHTS